MFRCERNFILWNKIGFCVSTQRRCVKDIVNLPTTPESATVGFVGIPASIVCMEDEEMAKFYNSLTYVAVDGMPIIKQARKKGIIGERCSGPDIMDIIIKDSIEKKKTHYFYGGKNEDVLIKIRNNLTNRYPQIRIAGMYSPPFRDLTEEEDKKICDEINKLKPDYVWVGIGQPRQDYWIEKHKTLLINTTILGVGAAFDFFAGTLDRAPGRIQKLGLEWLYRFIKEPKRLWKRYFLGSFKYIYYCIRCR